MEFFNRPRGRATRNAYLFSATVDSENTSLFCSRRHERARGYFREKRSPPTRSMIDRAAKKRDSFEITRV